MSNIDKQLDEIVLGLINWVDNEHIHSNDGSFRLSPEEAKSALNQLQEPRWWITDTFFKQGGLKVLGPFGSKELALEVRTLLEHASTHRTYAVDEELTSLVPTKPTCTHRLIGNRCACGAVSVTTGGSTKATGLVGNEPLASTGEAEKPNKSNHRKE